MRPIRLSFLISLLTATSLYSQNTTYLNGTVTDSLTRESMESVSVFLVEDGSGIYTNDDGQFRIGTTVPWPVTLRFSYVGYETATLRVENEDQASDIRIVMQPKGEQITEIVVQANSMRERFNSTNTSTESIDAREAQVLPALFGEVDIMKIIQLKPGISSGSEGSSSLFVRGGGGDQNLVLLDGVNIYNPSHLFGFFSTFNNDALESVEVFKGGFPAEYGGRLSSVIDVSSKPANENKLTGAGGIGIISSRLTLEGPIVKDKVNFMISGRRTYFDLFTEMVNKARDDDPDFTNIPRYRFYDLNGKLTARLSPKDQLSVSGYMGADIFGFQTTGLNADFDWGNQAGSLNWRHAYSDRLFFNTSVFLTNYEYNIANNAGEFDFNLGSRINNLGARWDLTFNPANSHFFKGGVQWIQHKFKIGRFKAESVSDNVEFSSGSNPEGQEWAAYLRDEFSPLDWLKVNLGVRYSGFKTNGQLYHNIEPRLAMNANLSDRFNLKASYTRMNQYIHLVASNGLSLPTDIWFPTTDHVKPQISDQYVIGLNYLIGPSLLLTNEYYYKTLQNQIELKDHSQIFINDDIEREFTFGEGDAYGTEIGLEKNAGKWTGWIGYTLAWVNRGNFKDIEGGAWFPPRHDRRHDLSLVATYEFNDRWTVSTSFVYGSGDKTWLPSGRFHLQDLDRYNNNYIVPIYGKRNSTTMPAYHRMDLSIVRSWETKWGSQNLNLSIYNLYNRRNPYFLYLDSELEYLPDSNLEVPVKVTARQVSLFPIIPSISWNFNF